MSGTIELIELIEMNIELNTNLTAIKTTVGTSLLGTIFENEQIDYIKQCCSVSTDYSYVNQIQPFSLKQKLYFKQKFLQKLLLQTEDDNFRKHFLTREIELINAIMEKLQMVIHKMPHGVLERAIEWWMSFHKDRSGRCASMTVLERDLEKYILEYIQMLVPEDEEYLYLDSLLRKTHQENEVDRQIMDELYSEIRKVREENRQLTEQIKTVHQTNNEKTEFIENLEHERSRANLDLFQLKKKQFADKEELHELRSKEELLVQHIKELNEINKTEINGYYTVVVVLLILCFGLAFNIVVVLSGNHPPLVI